MRNHSIALGIACLALAACSGGGGSNGNVPQAAAPIASPTGSSGASTSNAGKAAVTITFAIPAKGSPASAARRAPQYISPNTTQVNATFTPTNGGSLATGQAACTTNCTLQVFVTPGIYSVLVTAGDSLGPLSAGTATNFTVTLGAANTLTLSGPLVEVLASVQLTPALPATVYNGQVTPTSVTAKLLDADSNVLTQPGPWVDVNGNSVTGIFVTPSSPSGTETIGGSTSAVALTSATQTLSVSYAGTEPLPDSSSPPVGIATTVQTGMVGVTGLSSAVSSPFDVAQTNPLPYGGGVGFGSPQISVSDNSGTASIEYPSLSPAAQTLTVTDNDAAPMFPILVDPSSCIGKVSSFQANSTAYASVPIQINSYSGPFTITYTTAAAAAGNCQIVISDSFTPADHYVVKLYFDQNSLFVSSQKRSLK